MPLRRFTEYDGFSLTANGLHAGLMVDDAYGQWSNVIDERSRPGAHPSLGAVAMSARRIAMEITFPNGASADTINTLVQSIQGGLQPDKPDDPRTPRYLYAELADDDHTAVRRPAVIASPLEPTIAGGRNGLRVTFVSPDPAWRLVTPDHVDLDDVPGVTNLLLPYNPNFLTDLAGWEVSSSTAGITYTTARDAAVFHDAAGALRHTITANIAGDGASIAWRNSALLPVVAGATYAVRAFVRTTNVDLIPRIGLQWYDADSVALTADSEAPWSPTINAWTARDHEATAPDDAAFAAFRFVVVCDIAGPTGSVYLDEAEVREVDPTAWSSVALPNEGQARTAPLLTLDPTGQEDGSFWARFRRTMTVTNNADADMHGEVIEVDLGNTSLWTAATDAATADGDNVLVYRDGVPLDRELVGFGEARSTAWVYVDHLAAGADMTLVWVYGGTPPAAAGGLVGAHRPAFSIAWEVGTLAAGSTTTVLNVAGAPGWYPDQWADGALYVLSGAEADTERTISTSAAAAITLTSALGGAPAAGDRVLIRRSRQVSLGAVPRQVYNVAQVERSDLHRGLWYLNTGQDRPSDVRFDTPGAWEPFLYLDNTDEKNQPDFLRVNVGTVDSFAILDADRCAQGVRKLEAQGAADGVRISLIWPITGWTFDGAFRNPNGMCHAFFGSRPNETRNWAEVRNITTANDTIATFSRVATTLPDGTRHLCAAVLPADDEVIGPDWVRLTGSRTAGGASATATMTDATIAGTYADEQFVNGRLLITAGLGEGQRRTVTDFVAATGVFTVTPNWTTSLDDSSRYEVVNKQNVCTLRTNSTWVLAIDRSALVVGAIGSGALNYPAELVLRLDGGADGTAYPYHRLRVGGADRALFLTGSERLVLDCPNRRAWLTNVAGDVLSVVTAYVLSEALDEDGVATLAEEWLPMSPGEYTLWMQSRSLTSWTLDADVAAGYLG